MSRSFTTPLLLLASGLFPLALLGWAALGPIPDAAAEAGARARGVALAAQLDGLLLRAPRAVQAAVPQLLEEETFRAAGGAVLKSHRELLAFSFLGADGESIGQRSRAPDTAALTPEEQASHQEEVGTNL